MSKKVGYVYYAKSQRIDSSDDKKRRNYVVVKDNGVYVGVSKIRGLNANSKNSERLYFLDKNKYSLSKESGVDKKVYTTKAKSKEKLSLSDSSVFDSNPSFKLSSKDTHGVLMHVNLRSGKKNKKRSKI